MNPIIRHPNFIYTSYDFYFNYIKDNPQSFTIQYNDTDRIIKNIISNNKKYSERDDIVKNFLYFLYKYTKIDNITKPLDESDGGIPTAGFEFINKETYTGCGIYHCHLSNIDTSVLVWYPILKSNNKQYVHIEYLKHPSVSQYENLIKDIYNRNDDGYNINIGEYFSNSKHLLPTHLYESRILTFTQFNSDRI